MQTDDMLQRKRQRCRFFCVLVTYLKSLIASPEFSLQIGLLGSRHLGDGKQQFDHPRANGQ
jgi:hypothetical protein